MSGFSCTPIISFISLFRILSILDFPADSKTSIFVLKILFISLVGICQTSAPHVKMLWIMVWYICNFLFFVIFLLHQIKHLLFVLLVRFYNFHCVNSRNKIITLLHFSNTVSFRIEREKFFPGLGLEPRSPALRIGALASELYRINTYPLQNFPLVVIISGVRTEVYAVLCPNWGNDHRCCLGITSLHYMQRARVQSPVGSISLLIFPGFSLNHKTNVITFGPHSSPVITWPSYINQTIYHPSKDGDGLSP